MERLRDAAFVHVVRIYSVAEIVMLSVGHSTQLMGWPLWVPMVIFYGIGGTLGTFYRHVVARVSQFKVFISKSQQPY